MEAGLLKVGVRQRMDVTHVLAAVRRLSRLELVRETLRAALEELAEAAPAWLAPLVEPEWAKRYVTAAVAASPLVVVCVLDYDAARAVVGPVTATLTARCLVNLTADAPERAREMAAWAAGRNIAYLDGAIMTPTTTIGGPDAMVLHSGRQGCTGPTAGRWRPSAAPTCTSVPTPAGPPPTTWRCWTCSGPP